MRSALLSLALALILDGMAQAGAPEPSWTAEQRRHWSFQPTVRPEVPDLKDRDGLRSPIDAFIRRGLEEFGLRFAPEADRITLIRRLRFDLTGLPPTPGEIDAFVNDERPDAYERLVDRLLASPQYGERWARPWLDLARFAESDGFKSDKTRPNAWRYRDWVVRALNDDMPYDRFVRLQLAGDEFEPDDPDAFIATGFNRNWPFEDNNKVPGLNHQLMLDDLTDTTSAVFLGLTVGCARCHDHKFDPISQVDYYRIQALFAASVPDDGHSLADPFDSAVHDFVAASHRERLDNARHAVEAVERPYRLGLLRDRLDKLPVEVRRALDTPPEERSAHQEDLLRAQAQKMAVPESALRKAMSPEDRRLWESRRTRMAGLNRSAPADLPEASGMTDSGAEAPPVFLLAKGNLNRPGAVVAAGFPSVLDPDQADFARSQTRADRARSTGRRAALATWLTRPDHPLTARVMVNRLWQHHFGRGIVATPSDFGTQGATPSHPELLDWLASEFVARGWSLKAIHRLMVTSAAYRQSSQPPAATLAADPDNILLGRMPRRRLEGEMVRDAMLSVAGLLNPALGGAGVFPDLPPGIQTRGGWTRSEKASDRDRRSLYVFARRNLKYPLFDAFDAPDTNVTCPERNVSVNAPQALMLLNSGLVLDTARAFARRLTRDVGNLDDRESLIHHAYRLALGRQPDPEESSRAAAFLARGPAGPEEALADFCHALLNLNEFVFID